MNLLRHDWTEKEVTKIYNMPLLELIYRAASVHRMFHDPNEVQVSSLLSIKTGACSEDCAYCPQSARHRTGLKVEPLLPIGDVMDAAKNAKENGATRFCMGAAWREVRDNSDFEKVLDMVKGVNSLGMEVCCTLGMLTEGQAKRLKGAGLYAYNHNLDSSEEFYKKIITTRTYQERLETLENVRKAGITVCCGGIIGMGESASDRIKLLVTLSSLCPHPESVPINGLVPVKGTPLGENYMIAPFEMARMIATARIVLPKSVIRLSAGRMQLGKEGQALCFMAGASSIFAGDKLLTTPNPEFNEDMEMFRELGLKPRKAFKEIELEPKEF
jgi:biotin synthase